MAVFILVAVTFALVLMGSRISTLSSRMKQMERIAMRYWLLEHERQCGPDCYYLGGDASCQYSPPVELYDLVSGLREGRRVF